MGRRVGSHYRQTYWIGDLIYSYTQKIGYKTYSSFAISYHCKRAINWNRAIQWHIFESKYLSNNLEPCILQNIVCTAITLARFYRMRTQNYCLHTSIRYARLSLAAVSGNSLLQISHLFTSILPHYQEGSQVQADVSYTFQSIVVRVKVLIFL